MGTELYCRVSSNVTVDLKFSRVGELKPCPKVDQLTRTKQSLATILIA